MLCYSLFYWVILFYAFYSLFHWRHQDGIWEIAQLNSNKYGFRRTGIKTPEICNSDKKRLQCRCFPVNFTKFLRTLFYKTLSDDCFGYFLVHVTVTVFCYKWTNRNQVFSVFEHVSSRLSNVIDIMNFACGKHYFAKQMTQLLLQWSTHFSETPRIKRCF